jgi:hypothetical protein
LISGTGARDPICHRLDSVQGRNGTRVRLVHSGFVLPKNATAFKTMSEGWKKVARNLDAIAAQWDSSTPLD